MDGYISKPVQLGSLQAALERVAAARDYQEVGD
jgi:CheY-like chemotaxis protein